MPAAGSDRFGGGSSDSAYPKAGYAHSGKGRSTRIETLVETMLSLIDELNGDPDDEPSLGYHSSPIVDAEGPDDNGIADEGDLQEQLQGEPSLGWTATAAGRPKLPWPHVDWMEEFGDDAEQEHDGSEPSLGSLERLSQIGWGSSGTTDREPDGDEDEGEHA